MATLAEKYDILSDADPEVGEYGDQYAGPIPNLFRELGERLPFFHISGSPIKGAIDPEIALKMADETGIGGQMHGLAHYVTDSPKHALTTLTNTVRDKQGKDAPMWIHTELPADKRWDSPVLNILGTMEDLQPQAPFLHDELMDMARMPKTSAAYSEEEFARAQQDPRFNNPIYLMALKRMMEQVPSSSFPIDQVIGKAMRERAAQLVLGGMAPGAAKSQAKREMQQLMLRNKVSAAAKAVPDRVPVGFIDPSEYAIYEPGLTQVERIAPVPQFHTTKDLEDFIQGLH